MVDLTHHKVAVSQGQVNPPLLVGLNHHRFYSEEKGILRGIEWLHEDNDVWYMLMHARLLATITATSISLGRNH